jgi:hypothetical protein
MLNDAYCLLQVCLLTNILLRLVDILPWHFSTYNSWSNYIMNLVIIHGRILSYYLLMALFILVSIILTVSNTYSTFFPHCHIRRKGLGTFIAALTLRTTGVSQSSLPLSSSVCHSLSASQLSSLSFGLCKSPFQLCQFWVSEMLSGEQSCTLSAGWRSIRLIQQTFNYWVCPPGRSFADNAGGTADFADNLNAAAPSVWEFD